MSNKGWIKLHRQLQDCWVWKEGEFSKGQAWVDLLLSANHRPVKIPIDGKPVLIEQGQLHTSLCQLAQRWKWDKRKVGRFLDVLERDGMVTQTRTTHGTTLTIVNYGTFQCDSTTDSTTDSATDSTADSTPHGTQTRIKELKNEINIKHKHGFYSNVLLTDKDFETLQEEFPTDYEERIETLSSYIASTGKRYKNHLATIRNWAKRDNKKNTDSIDDMVARL